LTLCESRAAGIGPPDGTAHADDHALYHLNVATERQRAGFIARVEPAMRRLAA
jgi:hypothetical protein